MPRLRPVAMLLALTLLAHATYAADDPAPAAQATDSAAAAEQRVKEFLELLDAKDIAAFKKYIAENYAPIFKAMPMERHLEFFGAIRDITGGLDLESLENPAPHQVLAHCKARLSGRTMTLELRVEPKPPHRIAGLGSRASKTSGTSKKLSDDEMRAALQTLLQKLADADVFSGTVLLARDGVPVFEGVYGIANKDFDVPNQIDTRFNLGSMNKMFTAVAVAQLVERGKLSFDDPLSKYLPDFPDPEAAKKIQIKHLLSHTAGLGPYFSKAWQESSRGLYRTVDDQMKRAAADEKLLFEPGTRHRYSNTGMLVAGKVIEIASGHEKHYDENGVWYQNNLLEHSMRGGPQGGGYSTVNDLLKFDRALRGNKLVSADSVKLLLSAKPELMSPRYGYGFAIDLEQKIAGHGGGFLGISSNLDMFLDSPWTAAVMSNYGRGAMLPQQVMREMVLGQVGIMPGGGEEE